MRTQCCWFSRSLSCDDCFSLPRPPSQSEEYDASEHENGFASQGEEDDAASAAAEKDEAGPATEPTPGRASPTKKGCHFALTPGHSASDGFAASDHGGSDHDPHGSGGEAFWCLWLRL